MHIHIIRVTECFVWGHVFQSLSPFVLNHYRYGPWIDSPINSLNHEIAASLKSLSSTNTHAQAFQFITDSCKSESWTKATLRPLCRWRKTSHRSRAWGRRRLRQRGTSNQDNQPETKDILANITFNTVCTVFQIWPGGLIISSLKVFRMVRNLFMTSFFF